MMIGRRVGAISPYDWLWEHMESLVGLQLSRDHLEALIVKTGTPTGRFMFVVTLAQKRITKLRAGPAIV